MTTEDNRINWVGETKKEISTLFGIVDESVILVIARIFQEKTGLN